MLRVHGCRISYYTGKLEAYLRYREIPYEQLPTLPYRREIEAGAGAMQMPVVRLEDGRWLSDSTPIIAWFESRSDTPAIYPADPALRFVALLLEDYADEYLWRPAMHYRWSYRPDREYASAAIVDELTAGVKLPRFVKRVLVTRRQFRGFVRGDGVTEATRAHVEQGFTNALDRLDAVFATRPFLLGDTPTIADFGFMGPMLRHFGQDPTPARLMRNRASGVYEWVARVWNTRAKGRGSSLIDEVDAPLAALLVEVAETHLVQLRENARAWAEGLRRYDQEIQGCRYASVPASRYRVWCLEVLRREWNALDETARERLRRYLPEPASSVLWDGEIEATSDYDPEGLAPFNRAINVFDRGVPQR